MAPTDVGGYPLEKLRPFHELRRERNDLLSLSLSPSEGERVPKAKEGAAHGTDAR